MDMQTYDKINELVVNLAKHELTGRNLHKSVEEWRLAGLKLCSDFNVTVQHQVIAFARATRLLETLEGQDAFILEGAIDIDKVRKNIADMETNIAQSVSAWAQIDRALFAIIQDESEPVKNSEQKPVKKTPEPEHNDEGSAKPAKPAAPEQKPTKTVASYGTYDEKVSIKTPEQILSEKHKDEPIKKADKTLPLSKPLEPGGNWKKLDLTSIGYKDPEEWMINILTREVVNRKTGDSVSVRTLNGRITYMFTETNGVVASLLDKCIVSDDNPPKKTPEKNAANSGMKSRYIDWISDIPRIRFRIYEDGSVFNDHGVIVPRFANGTKVYLSDPAKPYNGKEYYVAELAWKAYHPSDRTKTGQIIHLNDNLADCNLSNLKFVEGVINKPPVKRSDIENITKTKPLEEESSIDSKVPKDESVPITWYKKLDPGKYAITRLGKVLDCKSGKEVRYKFLNGQKAVNLTSKNFQKLVTVYELLKAGFPDRTPVHVNRNGRINIEEVCQPVKPVKQDKSSDDADKVEAKELPVTETVEEIEADTTYVFLNWISWIPKNKYKIYKSGKIVDAYTKKCVTIDTQQGRVRLSNFNGRGIRDGKHKCRFCQCSAAALIWKAYHPECRSIDRIHMRHKDGDTRNFALSNLERVKRQ